MQHLHHLFLSPKDRCHGCIAFPSTVPEPVSQQFCTTRELPGLMRGSGESAVRGSMEQYRGMIPGVGFIQLRAGFKVRGSSLHSLLKPNRQQLWSSPSWMYF